jgi:hypothetical protein
VLLPSPFAGHQWSIVFAHRGDDRLEARWQALASELLEPGFGVKQIDVARATFHEQKDDALGLGRMMPLLAIALLAIVLLDRIGHTQQSALSEHGLEGDQSEAKARILEHASAVGGVEKLHNKTIFKVGIAGKIQGYGNRKPVEGEAPKVSIG